MSTQPPEKLVTEPAGIYDVNVGSAGFHVTYNLMAFRRQLGRIIPCLCAQTLKGKTPSHPSGWPL